MFVSRGTPLKIQMTNLCPILKRMDGIYSMKVSSVVV